MSICSSKGGYAVLLRTSVQYPNVGLRALRSLLLIEQCPGPSFDVTISRHSYAWKYRELVTLLVPSEGFADGGFKPPITGPMRKSLTIELPWQLE